ncbi:MAG: replication initiation protein [Nitrospirae bacterium]|nr:replication initiation protein [Nitrospirota bacterium]
MAKKNLKNLVVKANELVEAHYRLSLNEQKIILAMISRIKPDDADFKPIRFSIEELTGMIGVSGGAYHTEIRDIARDLRIKTLRLYNSIEDSYLDVGWLSASEYFNGKGYIELEFSPRLKPYLLQLKERFTAYQLQNVMRLDSSYSIRIYELLRQYGKIGKREFTVMELRKVLRIPDDQYHFYANFRKRVLLTAQKELQAKTDISFEFTEKKTGRAVTSLSFYVLTRLPDPPTDSIAADFTITDEYDLAVSTLPEPERALFTKLHTKYLLSKKQAAEVVTSILPRDGKEAVEALLSYCYSYWQKAARIDPKAHLGAITWTAFNDGWQVELELFKEPVKLAAKTEPPPEPTEKDKAEVKRLLADFYKRFSST